MSGDGIEGMGSHGLAIMPSPLAPTKCQTGRGQKVKTKSNTRKMGKEYRNKYKGRENTYMHTHSGSGVLQSTQLTKSFVLETLQEGAGKETPMTTKVSGKENPAMLATLLRSLAG